MRHVVKSCRGRRYRTWTRCLAVGLLLATAWCATVRAEEAPPADNNAVDPRRPAAIRTEDVPRVSAELVERLAPYQAVRQAQFLGWAADGRGMLIATRFGNAMQVHRVYEPGGRREQWTFFEEPVTGRPVPGANNAAALLSMARGGDENFQIYRFDPVAAQTTLLTDGVSRNELGPIASDGSKFVFHSNRRNGRDTDIFLARVDGSKAPEPLVQTNGQFWTAVDWSTNGQQLLLNRYVSINESYPAILELASRRLRLLHVPSASAVAYGAAQFLPGGERLVMTCDARGEFQQLVEFDLANGSYRWLAEDIGWDVEDVEVDDRSGRVAATINQDGASRLFFWESGQRRDVELPLGVVSDLEFSPDGTQLGFTLARPDAPADAFSISVADGRLTQWTYSEAGGLAAGQFIRPTQFRFPAHDGLQIPAYYFRPLRASSEEKAPVLIVIHGGPEAQYRPLFSGMFQFYVQKLGVAVICPNVRGSAGYGKRYLLRDNGPLRQDSVQDIGSLLDWIAEQPELDAGRVAVYGGSYGGYMVLASLVEFGERLRAGVDLVGIANFVTFLERTSPYRKDLRRAEYGDERDPAMRAVFERINPSAHAEKIRSALLVIHGVNDPRVPLFEAQQIAERVRSSGRTVWTVYADNEGHGFARKDNRDYSTAVEVMFLSEQLLGP